METGGLVRSEIYFRKPRGVRFRSENYCLAWHVKDAYDTVVEVDASDWAREFHQLAIDGRRHANILNHYMIYLDSFGCLEVLAESVDVQNVPSTDKNCGSTDPVNQTPFSAQ